MFPYLLVWQSVPPVQLSAFSLFALQLKKKIAWVIWYVSAFHYFAGESNNGIKYLFNTIGVLRTVTTNTEV